MPDGAAVLLLFLIFEDEYGVALTVTLDDALHRRARYVRLADQRTVVGLDEQNVVELDLGTRLCVELLDPDNLAFAHAVLFPTRSYDGVHDTLLGKR